MNTHTFAEVRAHIEASHSLLHEEPFLIGFEYMMLDSERKQSIFLAEIKDDNGHRYLRVETTVIPLAHFDAEKCLRINQMLRIGYLAVGDLADTPYIKMCHNLPYSNLDMAEIDKVIAYLAPMADDFEKQFEGGADIF